MQCLSTGRYEYSVAWLDDPRIKLDFTCDELPNAPSTRVRYDQRLARVSEHLPAYVRTIGP